MERSFTELLDDYLEAKKDYDEERQKVEGSWYYFENSHTYRRFHEARDALNAAFKRLRED